MGSKCCKCGSEYHYSSTGAASKSSGSIIYGPPIKRLKENEHEENQCYSNQNNSVFLSPGGIANDDESDFAMAGKNFNGDSLSSAYLRMKENSEIDANPIFLRKLNDLSVKVGTRTRFLVEVRSSYDLKVTWYRNDVPISEGERFRFLHEGNFFCVEVAPVTVEDNGRWACIAENFAGSSSCSNRLNVLIPKTYKPPEFLEELKAFLTNQGTVSLECKVVGVPTPVLKWYKDGLEIKAGDLFALRVNPDNPSSLGTYTCEAINCMGKTCSSSRVRFMNENCRKVSLSPIDFQPPRFSKGLEDKKTKIGEGLVLSCQVAVPPWPSSIQWYNREGIVEPTEKYHIMEDGLGGYSIEIYSVDASDEGEWKCVAKSNAGAVSTSQCTVEVSYLKNYRKPKFLEGLRTILTKEGLVSFECKVIGFPTPQLRWFKDGQELKPGDVYLLTGTNSLGSYSCIAKNCMGEARSTAELTLSDIQYHLNDQEKLQLFSKNQPPRFIQGLKSYEVKINEDYRFTVKVTVVPETNLSWYKDDEKIEPSDKYIIERKSLGVCHLDIKPLEITDQGEWKCVATNDFGQSITSCFLKLIIPKHYKKPRFLEGLRATLTENGFVNLECKVIGVPQPTLKWYKDEKELKPGDMHKIITKEDGTCCLGTYKCEAKNCMGLVSSSASLLGLEDRNAIKESAIKPVYNLTKNTSLSTIQEERTSQMHDSPMISEHSAMTVHDRGDVSFSFDGKEVSISLYETPDLTEDEALQVVEMYAEELSERVSEKNKVELPPLRFTKNSSKSGPLLMEAVVVDVTPEYFSLTEEDQKTEDDLEDVSMTEETFYMRSSSSSPPPAPRQNQKSLDNVKVEFSEKDFQKHETELKKQSEEKSSESEKDSYRSFSNCNKENDVTLTHKSSTDASFISASEMSLKTRENSRKMSLKMKSQRESDKKNQSFEETNESRRKSQKNFTESESFEEDKNVIQTNKESSTDQMKTQEIKNSSKLKDETHGAKDSIERSSSVEKETDTPKPPKRKKKISALRSESENLQEEICDAQEKYFTEKSANEIVESSNSIEFMGTSSPGPKHSADNLPDYDNNKKVQENENTSTLSLSTDKKPNEIEVNNEDSLEIKEPIEPEISSEIKLRSFSILRKNTTACLSDIQEGFGYLKNQIEYRCRQKLNKLDYDHIQESIDNMQKFFVQMNEKLKLEDQKTDVETLRIVDRHLQDFNTGLKLLEEKKEETETVDVLEMFKLILNHLRDQIVEIDKSNEIHERNALKILGDVLEPSQVLINALDQTKLKFPQRTGADQSNIPIELLKMLVQPVQTLKEEVESIKDEKNVPIAVLLRFVDDLNSTVSIIQQYAECDTNKQSLSRKILERLSDPLRQINKIMAVNEVLKPDTIQVLNEKVQILQRELANLVQYLLFSPSKSKSPIDKASLPTLEKLCKITSQILKKLTDETSESIPKTMKMKRQIFLPIVEPLQNFQTMITQCQDLMDDEEAIADSISEQLRSLDSHFQGVECDLKKLPEKAKSELNHENLIQIVKDIRNEISMIFRFVEFGGESTSEIWGALLPPLQKLNINLSVKKPKEEMSGLKNTSLSLRKSLELIRQATDDKISGEGIAGQESRMNLAVLRPLEKSLQDLEEGFGVLLKHVLRNERLTDEEKPVIKRQIQSLLEILSQSFENFQKKLEDIENGQYSSKVLQEANILLNLVAELNEGTDAIQFKMAEFENISDNARHVIKKHIYSNLKQLKYSLDKVETDIKKESFETIPELKALKVTLENLRQQIKTSEVMVEELEEEKTFSTLSEIVEKFADNLEKNKCKTVTKENSILNEILKYSVNLFMDQLTELTQALNEDIKPPGPVKEILQKTRKLIVNLDEKSKILNVQTLPSFTADLDQFINDVKYEKDEIPGSFVENNLGEEEILSQWQPQEGELFEELQEETLSEPLNRIKENLLQEILQGQSYDSLLILLKDVPNEMKIMVPEAFSELSEILKNKGEEIEKNLKCVIDMLEETSGNLGVLIQPLQQNCLELAETLQASAVVETIQPSNGANVSLVEKVTDSLKYVSNTTKQDTDVEAKAVLHTPLYQLLETMNETVQAEKIDENLEGILKQTIEPIIRVQKALQSIQQVCDETKLETNTMKMPKTFIAELNEAKREIRVIQNTIFEKLDIQIKDASGLKKFSTLLHEFQIGLYQMAEESFECNQTYQTASFDVSEVLQLITNCETIISESQVLKEEIENQIYAPLEVLEQRLFEIAEQKPNEKITGTVNSLIENNRRLLSVLKAGEKGELEMTEKLKNVLETLCQCLVGGQSLLQSHTSIETSSTPIITLTKIAERFQILLLQALQPIKLYQRTTNLEKPSDKITEVIHSIQSYEAAVKELINLESQFKTKLIEPLKLFEENLQEKLTASNSSFTAEITEELNKVFEDVQTNWSNETKKISDDLKLNLLNAFKSEQDNSKIQKQIELNDKETFKKATINEVKHPLIEPLQKLRKKLIEILETTDFGEESINERSQKEKLKIFVHLLKQNEELLLNENIFPKETNIHLTHLMKIMRANAMMLDESKILDPEATEILQNIMTGFKKEMETIIKNKNEPTGDPMRTILCQSIDTINQAIEREVAAARNRLITAEKETKGANQMKTIILQSIFQSMEQIKSTLESTLESLNTVDENDQMSSSVLEKVNTMIEEHQTLVPVIFPLSIKNVQDLQQNLNVILHNLKIMGQMSKGTEQIILFGIMSPLELLKNCIKEELNEKRVELNDKHKSAVIVSELLLEAKEKVGLAEEMVPGFQNQYTVSLDAITAIDTALNSMKNIIQIYKDNLCHPMLTNTIETALEFIQEREIKNTPNNEGNQDDFSKFLQQTKIPRNGLNVDEALELSEAENLVSNITALGDLLVTEQQDEANKTSTDEVLNDQRKTSDHFEMQKRDEVDSGKKANVGKEEEEECKGAKIKEDKKEVLGEKNDREKKKKDVDDQKDEEIIKQKIKDDKGKEKGELVKKEENEEIIKQAGEKDKTELKMNNEKEDVMGKHEEELNEEKEKKFKKEEFREDNNLMKENEENAELKDANEPLKLDTDKEEEDKTIETKDKALKEKDKIIQDKDKAMKQTEKIINKVEDKIIKEKEEIQEQEKNNNDRDIPIERKDLVQDEKNKIIKEEEKVIRDEDKIMKEVNKTCERDKAENEKDKMIKIENKTIKTKEKITIEDDKIMEDEEEPSKEEETKIKNEEKTKKKDEEKMKREEKKTPKEDEKTEKEKEKTPKEKEKTSKEEEKMSKDKVKLTKDKEKEKTPKEEEKMIKDEEKMQKEEETTPKEDEIISKHEVKISKEGEKKAKDEKKMTKEEEKTAKGDEKTPKQEEKMPKEEVKSEEKEKTQKEPETQKEDEKITKDKVKMLKEIQKTPKVEEKTSKEEKKLPKEDEKMTKEEVKSKGKTPKEEEKMKKDEEKTPNEDEKTENDEKKMIDEEERPKEDEIMTKDEVKTGKEEVKLPKEEEKMKKEEKETKREEVKLTKEKEKTSKEEAKMPKDKVKLIKDEEKMTKDEVKTPKEEEKTADDEEKTGKEKKKMPNEEEKTPKEDDKMMKDEVETSKEEEKMPKDEMKLTRVEEETSKEEKTMMKEEETTPKEEEKTPKEKEKTAKDEKKMTKEEEKTPKEDEKIMKEEEKMRKDEETTVKEKEKIPKEEEIMVIKEVKLTRVEEKTPKENDKMTTVQEKTPIEEVKLTNEKAKTPKENEKRTKEDEKMIKDEMKLTRVEEKSKEKEKIPKEEETPKEEEKMPKEKGKLKEEEKMVKEDETTSKEEENKIPKGEEKTATNEKKMTIDKEETPKEEVKTPTENVKLPRDEEKDKKPKEEEKTSKDNEKMTTVEEKTPIEEVKLTYENAKTPKEEEKRSKEEEKMLEDKVKLAKQEEKMKKQEEQIPKEDEKMTNEEKTVKEKRKTPKVDEKMTKEEETTPKEEASKSKENDIKMREEIDTKRNEKSEKKANKENGKENEESKRDMIQDEHVLKRQNIKNDLGNDDKKKAGEIENEGEKDRMENKVEDTLKQNDKEVTQKDYRVEKEKENELKKVIKEEKNKEILEKDENQEVIKEEKEEENEEKNELKEKKKNEGVIKQEENNRGSKKEGTSDEVTGDIREAIKTEKEGIKIAEERNIMDKLKAEKEMKDKNKVSKEDQEKSETKKVNEKLTNEDKIFKENSDKGMRDKKEKNLTEKVDESTKKEKKVLKDLIVQEEKEDDERNKVGENENMNVKNKIENEVTKEDKEVMMDKDGEKKIKSLDSEQKEKDEMHQEKEEKKKKKKKEENLATIKEKREEKLRSKTEEKKEGGLEEKPFIKGDENKLNEEKENKQPEKSKINKEEPVLFKNIERGNGEDEKEEGEVIKKKSEKQEMLLKTSEKEAVKIKKEKKKLMNDGEEEENKTIKKVDEEAILKKITDTTGIDKNNAEKILQNNFKSEEEIRRVENKNEDEKIKIKEEQEKNTVKEVTKEKLFEKEEEKEKKRREDKRKKEIKKEYEEMREECDINDKVMKHEKKDVIAGKNEEIETMNEEKEKPINKIESQKIIKKDTEKDKENKEEMNGKMIEEEIVLRDEERIFKKGERKELIEKNPEMSSAEKNEAKDKRRREEKKELVKKGYSKSLKKETKEDKMMKPEEAKVQKVYDQVNMNKKQKGIIQDFDSILKEREDETAMKTEKEESQNKILFGAFELKKEDDDEGVSAKKKKETIQNVIEGEEKEEIKTEKKGAIKKISKKSVNQLRKWGSETEQPKSTDSSRNEFEKGRHYFDDASNSKTTSFRSINLINSHDTDIITNDYNYNIQTGKCEKSTKIKNRKEAISIRSAIEQDFRKWEAQPVWAEKTCLNSSDRVQSPGNDRFKILPKIKQNYKELSSPATKVSFDYDDAKGFVEACGFVNSFQKVSRTVKAEKDNYSSRRDFHQDLSKLDRGSFGRFAVGGTSQIGALKPWCKGSANSASGPLFPSPRTNQSSTYERNFKVVPIPLLHNSRLKIPIVEISGLMDRSLNICTNTYTKYKRRMREDLNLLKMINVIHPNSCRAVYNWHLITNLHGRIYVPCPRWKGSSKAWKGSEVIFYPPIVTRLIQDSRIISKDELKIEGRGKSPPSFAKTENRILVKSSDRSGLTETRDDLYALNISRTLSQLNNAGQNLLRMENALVLRSRHNHVTSAENRRYLERRVKAYGADGRQLKEGNVPQFDTKLQDYKVPIGDTVALLIELKSAPRKVKWFQDKEKLPIISGNLRSLDDTGVCMLMESGASKKANSLQTSRSYSGLGHTDTSSYAQMVETNRRDGKPPQIINKPANMITVTAEDDIILTCRIKGEPRPKVTWFKGLKNIDATPKAMVEHNDDYYKFTLKRVGPSDAGTYWIVAKNTYGIDKAFITVQVKQRARSLTPVPFSDSRYNLGSRVSVTSRFDSKQNQIYGSKETPDRISGEPFVTDGGRNWLTLSWNKPANRGTAPIVAYRVDMWEINEKSGAHWTELGVSPVNSFEVFNLKSGINYKFRITPKNRYGWGEPYITSAPITVDSKIVNLPEFVKILPGHLKVLLGEDVNLNCSVQSDTTPTINWYKNSRPIDFDSNNKLSQIFDGVNCTLKIENVDEEDSGRYMCEAVNKRGRVSTFAWIMIVTDPKILEADAHLKKDLEEETSDNSTPQFTMRLRDRRIQMTYPVRLTCEVLGNPVPEVIWFKDGVQLHQNERLVFTNKDHFYTLEITKTNLEDSGSYAATAQNENGSVSCRCNLIVDKGIRAYIAPLFLNELPDTKEVKFQKELRLSAQIEAYPSVGVVWHRNGVRLRPSRRIIMTLDHDGTVELAIAHMTPKESGTYTCTATNQVGRSETTCKVSVVSDTSESSTPQIQETELPYSKVPIFITKPRSSEAIEGDTIIIECEVVGDPKPEVFWLRDFLKPNYYRDSSSFRMQGKGPKYCLEIPNAKLDFTGTYSVVARNIHGEVKAVISLQIYAKGQGKRNNMECSSVIHGNTDTIPVFKKGLKNLRCCDGDAVTLECVVSAPVSPEIRWKKDGKSICLGDDFEAHYDGSKASLNIKQVYPEDEGEYTCIAFNEVGQTFTSACLLVDVPEEKENFLSTQLSREAGVWSKASTPISTPRATPSRSVSPNAALGKEESNNSLSRPKRLKVSAPKFYTIPHNKIAEEGETVRFQCSVTGHPQPWVHWDKDNVTVTPSTRIKISEQDDLKILEIEEVTNEDAGLYRIIVENQFGRIEATARLDVLKPKNSSKAHSALAICPSKNVRRMNSFGRVGDSTNTLSLTSSDCNEKPMKTSCRTTSSLCEENFALKIKNFRVKDFERYLVKNNMVKTTCSPMALMIDDNYESKISPPAFKTIPKDLVVNEGQATELLVTITGTGPIQFVWVKDGKIIPNCKDFLYVLYSDQKFSLRIADTFVKDSGKYWCVIFNRYGSAISSIKLSVKENTGQLGSKIVLNENTSSTVTNLYSTAANDTGLLHQTSDRSSTIERQDSIMRTLGYPSANGECDEHEDQCIRESGQENNFHFERQAFGNKNECQKSLPNFLSYSTNFKNDDMKNQSEKQISQPVKSIPQKNMAKQPEQGFPSINKDSMKQTPAAIIKGPIDSDVFRGEKVILRATYEGYPEPQLQWMKGDQTLQNTDKINIVSGEGATSLSIDCISTDDSGKYLVRVENSLGSDCQFAFVAVRGPPDPPVSSPLIRNVGNNAVSIEWSSPAFDGGSQIIGYVVEMKNSTNEEWKVVSGLCQSLSYVMKNIPEDSKTRFRIKAENAYGQSEPSEESNEVTASDFEPPSESKIMTIEPGDDFKEKYEVLEELGKGRFGVVHLVVDVRTSQKFAAKFIKCIKLKDKEKVKEEINIMNTLSHSKLLKLEAAYERSREIIMITEYISGGELFERIVATDFQLTERDCTLFIRQICEGVEYMHQNQIVHLDLKPENIMCQSRTSHEIKLIDFGLAQKLEPNDSVRVFFGTPEFVAPEIINYEPIGFGSDMWSIGVICYVLLSGLSPFMGENDAETFANITRSTFDFDDEAFESISQDAKDFISMLLVKRKEKRLTASQCLKNKWIMSDHDNTTGVILSTDKLKKFIIRRKWQKTTHAIRALGRMALWSAANRKISTQSNQSYSLEVSQEKPSESLKKCETNHSEQTKYQYEAGNINNLDLLEEIIDEGDNEVIAAEVSSQKNSSDISDCCSVNFIEDGENRSGKSFTDSKKLLTVEEENDKSRETDLKLETPETLKKNMNLKVDIIRKKFANLSKNIEEVHSKLESVNKKPNDIIPEPTKATTKKLEIFPVNHLEEKEKSKSEKNNTVVTNQMPSATLQTHSEVSKPEKITENLTFDNGPHSPHTSLSTAKTESTESTESSKDSSLDGSGNLDRTNGNHISQKIQKPQPFQATRLGPSVKSISQKLEKGLLAAGKNSTIVNEKSKTIPGIRSINVKETIAFWNR